MSKSRFLKYAAIGLIGLSSAFAAYVKYREEVDSERPLSRAGNSRSAKDAEGWVYPDGVDRDSNGNYLYDFSVPEEVFHAFVESQNNEYCDLLVKLIDPSFYLSDWVINPSPHIEAEPVPEEYKNVFGGQSNFSGINKNHGQEILSVMRKRTKTVLCGVTWRTYLFDGKEYQFETGGKDSLDAKISKAEEDVARLEDEKHNRSRNLNLDHHIHGTRTMATNILESYEESIRVAKENLKKLITIRNGGMEVKRGGLSTGLLFDQFVERYRIVLESDTGELIGKNRERTLKELNPQKDQQEPLTLLGFDSIDESISLIVEWKPRNREMEACGYHIVSRGSSKFVYPRQYSVNPKELHEIRKLKEQKKLQSQNK